MYSRKAKLILFASGLALALVGCSDDTTESGPTQTGTQAGEILVSGAIDTDATWTAANVYRLTDLVFVGGGATLTIEAGTRVIGDRRLLRPVTDGYRFIPTGVFFFSSPGVSGSAPAGSSSLTGCSSASGIAVVGSTGAGTQS